MVAKNNELMLLWYLPIFFLCGWIHVLLYGVPYTQSIMLLLYGILAMAWGLSIRHRIVDLRVRRRILYIIEFLELYFLLQIGNFDLFDAVPHMKRWCWYAYYIPMLFISLMFFALSTVLNLPEDEKPKVDIHWLMVSAILISVGFVTNDIHQWAFRFTTEIRTPNAPKQFGPLYYLFVAAVVMLMAASFVIILRKCRLTLAKRCRWIPVVPLLLVGLYMLCQALGWKLRIQGISLWNMAEVYFFGTICFLESCIQIGLIPANSFYEEIFLKMRVPAAIQDRKNQVLYHSAGMDHMQEDRDYEGRKMEIAGGSVSWHTDLTELHDLNRQIAETTEQIEKRNDYLRTANRVKEEKAMLEARNRLYDSIASQVEPQLILTERLLEEADEKNFSEILSRIAVIQAYIKRRSNMEIMAAGTGRLPVAELELALRESMEYLKLCRVETGILVRREGDLPAGMLTDAYEFFETTVEEHLENLSGLFVNLNGKDGHLSLRIRLRHRDDPQEMDDTPILWEMQEGGDGSC